MIYVFDTNSFSELNAYYPDIFKSFWDKFNAMVAAGSVTSTREVKAELNRSGLTHTMDWAKANGAVFTTPNAQETAFVREILAVKHFQALIDSKAIQRGTPVADPFVIARARVCKGSVITQEKLKPNAAKIPNVCVHFEIPCMDLQGFMRMQGWSF